MAVRKTSRTRSLATLEYPYPVKVEVRAAEFELYSSLSYLDASKLSKGNHKIEVGVGQRRMLRPEGIRYRQGGNGGGCRGRTLPRKQEAVVQERSCSRCRRISRRSAAGRRSGCRSELRSFVGKPAVLERLRVTIGGGCISITWGDGTDSSPRHSIICCGADERIVCSIITVIEVSF